jgi:hypothetical protein
MYVTSFMIFVACGILQGRSQETSNTGAAAGVCEETAEPTAALLEGLNEQVGVYAGSWRALLVTSISFMLLLRLCNSVYIPMLALC